MPEQEKTETSSNNLSLISAITGKVDDAPHAGPSASAGASDAALGPGAPGTLMPSSVPREAGFAPLPSPAPTVPVVEGAFAPPFGYPAPVAPAQTGYSPAPQLVAKAATAQTFNVNLQKNFSFSRYAKMESNLSWLKIIAILLVTLTHSMQSGWGFWGSVSGGGGIVGMTSVYGPINPWILMFLEIFSVVCVNLFVVISCFLETRSLKVKFFKFIKLYLIITGIQMFTQALEWIIAAGLKAAGDPNAHYWSQVGPDSWKDWLKCFIWFYYEDPWYFTAYFAFLLICPFINLLYSKMSLNGKNVAFGVVIFVFISWKLLFLFFGTGQGFIGATSTLANVPLSTVNLTGNTGSISDSILGRGYNFLNFFVIYAIVQWIVAHDFFRRFKKGWWPLYLVSLGLMYLTTVWVSNTLVSAYSNPFTILMSVCLLGGFLNINFKKRKTVNWLSTLTLYIFAMHWNPLGKVFIQGYMKDAVDTVFKGGGNFPIGNFYAPQDAWVGCQLLWWVVFSACMFAVAMIVDATFKLITATPGWIRMVDWLKKASKLEKFEAIAEAKIEAKAAKPESGTPAK